MKASKQADFGSSLAMSLAFHHITKFLERDPGAMNRFRVGEVNGFATADRETAPSGIG